MPPRDISLSSRVGGLLAAAVVIAGLYFGKDVLMPMALAVLLAFLLVPIVTRIERLRVGRIISVIATMVVVGLAMGGVGWLLASQLADLGKDLPAYKEALLAKAGAIRASTGVVQSVTDTIEEIDEELTQEKTEKSPSKQKEDNADSSKNQESVLVDRDGGSKENAVEVDPAQMTWWDRAAAPFTGPNTRSQPLEVKVTAPAASPLAQAREWLGPLLSPILTIGLVIVLVAFFLFEREDLRNRVVELFGASNLSATTEAMRDAEARVTKYLRAQFLLNASMGLAVGLAMWAFGVPAPLLWGVLAMLLRFVPYLGPVLALALPVLISLAVFPGWARPLGVLSFFLLAELIWNNVLEPIAYGSSAGISQTGVIVSAIFWTVLWGPVGLVLAMPLTVCLVILGRYVPQMRFISVLLRDRTELSVDERIYQRLLAHDDYEAGRIAEQHIDRDHLERSLDETMIGALCLVEQGRHAGIIDDDRGDYVCRAVRDISSDLINTDRQNDPKVSATGPAVLCVPVGDAADEAANEVFTKLLVNRGVTVESMGVGSLPSEVIEAVDRLEARMIVLSVLPPVSLSSGRYLCRSLRARFPQLSIMVAIWRGDEKGPLTSRFEGDGATTVVTSLATAVSRVRQYAVSPEPPRAQLVDEEQIEAGPVSR